MMNSAAALPYKQMSIRKLLAQNAVETSKSLAVGSTPTSSSVIIIVSLHYLQ